MGQKLSEDHIYNSERGNQKVTKLNEDHLLPSKVQRFKRGSTFVERAHSALFNSADDVLDCVYVDICNGIARSDITQKLMKGLYEPQKRGMTYRQAQEYYNCALDRMHYNTDVEHARLKDIFYNRYESLLETAIKKEDVYNARAILTDMAKIFLGTEQKNTNIQINSSEDGKIIVNFGLDNKDGD